MSLMSGMNEPNMVLPSTYEFCYLGTANDGVWRVALSPADSYEALLRSYPICDTAREASTPRGS